MSNGTVVATLIATYNGAAFLRSQLDSLLAQRQPNVSFVVRDDQSKDMTIFILDEYVERYAPKLRMISDEKGNLGVTKNFETLLCETDADYYFLSDQDDIWQSDKIERFMKEFKALEAEEGAVPLLIHSDATVIDAEGRTIAASLWEYKRLFPALNVRPSQLIFNNTATGCCMAFNRKAKEAALPFPKKIPMHDWWIAFSTSRKGRVHFIPDRTILYRVHGGNIVGAEKADAQFLLRRLKDVFPVLARYFRMLAAARFRVNIIAAVYWKMKVYFKRFSKKEARAS